MSEVENIPQQKSSKTRISITVIIIFLTTIAYVAFHDGNKPFSSILSVDNGVDIYKNTGRSIYKQIVDLYENEDMSSFVYVKDRIYSYPVEGFSRADSAQNGAFELKKLNFLPAKNGGFWVRGVFSQNIDPQSLDFSSISIKPDQKEEVKPDQKEEVKPDQKEEVKPDQKEEVKPDQKEEVKPDQKEEVKPDQKEEVKPDQKEEVKPDQKEEVKPDQKEEVKPDQKEEVKPDQKEEVKKIESSSISSLIASQNIFIAEGEVSAEPPATAETTPVETPSAPAPVETTPPTQDTSIPAPTDPSSTPTPTEQPAPTDPSQTPTPTEQPAPTDPSQTPTPSQDTQGQDTSTALPGTSVDGQPQNPETASVPTESTPPPVEPTPKPINPENLSTSKVGNIFPNIVIVNGNQVIMYFNISEITETDLITISNIKSLNGWELSNIESKIEKDDGLDDDIPEEMKVNVENRYENNAQEMMDDLKEITLRKTQLGKIGKFIRKYYASGEYLNSFERISSDVYHFKSELNNYDTQPGEKIKILNSGYGLMQDVNLYLVDLVFSKTIDPNSIRTGSFTLENMKEENFTPTKILIPDTDNEVILIFDSSQNIDAKGIKINNVLHTDSNGIEKLNGYFHLDTGSLEYVDLTSTINNRYEAVLNGGITFNASKLNFGIFNNLMSTNATIAIDVLTASPMNDKCSLMVFGNNLKNIDDNTGEIPIDGLTLISKSSGGVPLDPAVIADLETQKQKKFIGFVYLGDLEVSTAGNYVLYLNLSSPSGVSAGMYQSVVSIEPYCPMQ